jgi:hypothetical protein
MSQQVMLINPANAQSYTFDVNPGFDAETQGGVSYMQKKRNIEYTSNTGNIGLTRQQGADGNYLLHWQFNVFSAAQEQALWKYYMLSKTQSIILEDFNGEIYEGQIVTLARQRAGVLAGPRDATARKFYAQYTFEFDVWAFISGLLASAGVTP